MTSFSLKGTITYSIYRQILAQFVNLVSTIGDIVRFGAEVIFNILKGNIRISELIEQCSRFGVSSLPITLSIVGMTSIIVSMQVAGEMVKQGAGNYVGLLVAMLIIREAGIIMSGFAIISMIGSSLASEVATMRVTEQIDAIKVLKVNPIEYLFVPRVLSGVLMMPPVLVVASVVGIIAGGISSNLASGLTYRAYFESVWRGLYLKDMNVAILKAIVFGFTIALISCTCGYQASGGAKGVGQATTKAVVWSFVAIVILDLIFSIIFFF
ncbi:MAG: ABC transporter permease [Candidatus Gastranaerophilales bacterium]|nr:ABC transporter permease [Candidatus Gastranaerophilales bacterium]